MATWDDLNLKDKRQYVGWVGLKLRAITKSYDERKKMVVKLAIENDGGTPVLDKSQRDKIKARAEEDIDKEYAAITVDNFLIEQSEPTP